MTVHDIDPDFPAEIWPQHWERMKRAGSLTFEAKAMGFFHSEDRPKLARAIRQAIDRGVPSDMDIRGITATGKPRWTQTICVPHVVNGKTVRLTGTFQDITDRKRAEEEEERLAAHLRHSQKMEAIGLLAGGVAHDFNNYLTVILANADLPTDIMQRGLDEESAETVKAGLEETKNGGNRASRLTQQLVSIGRKKMLKGEVLDLRQVMGEAKQMLRGLLREEIEFKVLVQEDVHRIRVDAGQIEQIVMNLVLNARDAIEGAGTLTVECANVVLDDAHGAANIGANTGPHVMLGVSDTGSGMSRKTIEHIFEPFFTTKPNRGKGTGLDLPPSTESPHRPVPISASKANRERAPRFESIFLRSKKTRKGRRRPKEFCRPARTQAVRPVTRATKTLSSSAFISLPIASFSTAITWSLEPAGSRLRAGVSIIVVLGFLWPDSSWTCRNL